MPLGALRPYDGNAKKHTEEQLEAVKNSIREFGFRNPVIAWHDQDGRAEIVAGHARCKAAQELGMESVPVVFCDDLTDAQRRALTLVDNQTTMMTGWDEDALAYELDVLSGDFDMADFGFDLDAPGELETPTDLVEDEVPEEVVCRCKPGEVWKLGSHRVMCGSATDAGDVERLMGGAVADLYLTDPPYNVALGHHDSPSEARQLHRRTDGLLIANDSWDDDDAFVEFLKQAFANALDVMKPGAAFYIWYAGTQGINFQRACKECGMQVRQGLVWVKNTFSLGRQDYQWKHEPCLYGWKDGAAHWFTDARDIATVFEDAYSANVEKMKKSELRALVKEMLSDGVSTTVIHEDKPAASREHPTMKPIRLMGRLIQNSSRPGQVVLDSFGGSGSTLIACEQLGRKCMTMELDPHYCDVIIERWERLTGETAVLDEQVLNRA